MPSREVRCSCGAINDVDFGSCIRCGRKLGAPAEAATPAPVRVRDEAPMAGPGTTGLLIGGLCSVVFAVQLALVGDRELGFQKIRPPGALRVPASN